MDVAESLFHAARRSPGPFRARRSEPPGPGLFRARPPGGAAGPGSGGRGGAGALIDFGGVINTPSLSPGLCSAGAARVGLSRALPAVFSLAGQGNRSLGTRVLLLSHRRSIPAPEQCAPLSLCSRSFPAWNLFHGFPTWNLFHGFILSRCDL